MDTSDPPCARQLYLEILKELDRLELADRKAQDAVLLRIIELTGKLAEIAERDEGFPDAFRSGGPAEEDPDWIYLLTRISLELLRIMSGADFYRTYQNELYPLHDKTRIQSWPVGQTDPSFPRRLAA